MDTVGPDGTGKDLLSLTSRLFSVRMLLANQMKRNGDSYVIKIYKNVKISDIKIVDHYHVHLIKLSAQKLLEIWSFKLSLDYQNSL